MEFLPEMTSPLKGNTKPSFLHLCSAALPPSQFATQQRNAVNEPGSIGSLISLVSQHMES